MAIDLDLSCANAIGDFCGFGWLTLDVSSEAILRIIRHFDRFIDTVIRDHDKHGAEDFFAGDRHLIGHVCEDGWACEVAAIETFRTARAACDQGRALINTFLDEVLDFRILIAVRDWADGAFVSLAWHLNLYGFSGCFRNRFGFFIALARNEHAARRITRLARIGHHLHDAAANSFL